MKFQEMDYNIGAHFASALINGDYSGLDDAEEKLFNDWLEQNEMRGGHWDMVGDDIEFTRCEISNLMGDCFTARQYYPARV